MYHELSHRSLGTAKGEKKIAQYKQLWGILTMRKQKERRGIKKELESVQLDKEASQKRIT